MHSNTPHEPSKESPSITLSPAHRAARVASAEEDAADEHRSARRAVEVTANERCIVDVFGSTDTPDHVSKRS